jgi:glycosyltransferase involved in cell wall biosynthesis
MNLLFLTPNVQRSCGRSQHVLALMSELTARGHACVLGTNGGSLLPQFQHAGIRCECLPIDPQRKNPGDAWRTVQALKRIAGGGRMDLVHSHHRWPELLASFALRPLGVPTVSTCHNLRQGRIFLSYRSDRIIAVSEAVRALLTSRFRVPGDRVLLIHQAPRPIPRPTVGEIARFEQEHGIQTGDRVVSCVGRFHREKGFDVMVKAALLHGDHNLPVRWLLVGHGDERPALERAIATGGGDIQIVDAVENMGVVYARTNVLVVPSRDDAMPLVPLEAAAFAVPVVATSVGGLPEVIRDGVTGRLVPPERPELLLRAVIELLTDRRLAAACGANLRTLVESEHSLADMVAKTEDLYASLLSGRRAQP